MRPQTDSGACSSYHIGSLCFLQVQFLSSKNLVHLSGTPPFPINMQWNVGPVEVPPPSPHGANTTAPPTVLSRMGNSNLLA